jgi:3-dehydroquinate synthase
VDYAVLDTLPAREMQAGFAEVVKYGLIGDRAFFDWLRGAGAAVLARQTEALARAVVTSIEAKAAIVAADERETADLRALLNLGHTFGHGFEAMAGFDGRLLHGEAVACGMALAFHYSAQVGLCPAAEAQEAIAALRAFGFETDPRRLAGGPFTADGLIEAMAQDKKAVGGKLTLILAEGIGRAKVVSGLDLNPVQAYLSAVLTGGLN